MFFLPSIKNSSLGVSSFGCMLFVGFSHPLFGGIAMSAKLMNEADILIGGIPCATSIYGVALSSPIYLGVCFSARLVCVVHTSRVNENIAKVPSLAAHLFVY